MPFTIKSIQMEHLNLLSKYNTADVITLCKNSFDYKENGPEQQEIYKAMASKYDKFEVESVQFAMKTLISLFIDAAKAKATESELKELLCLSGFREDTVFMLTQFVLSKSIFIEGSMKTVNIRGYRFVNIEWRLEAKLASRLITKHSQVYVVIKLYLDTETKNKNSNFLDRFHVENRNRIGLLVQTDLASLNHMIHVLEEALLEARSRRTRNIIDAIR